MLLIVAGVFQFNGIRKGFFIHFVSKRIVSSMLQKTGRRWYHFLKHYYEALKKMEPRFFVPFRSQSIDLLFLFRFRNKESKSMDWFLYDRDLRHERVMRSSPNFASDKWKENWKTKKIIKKRTPRKYFPRNFLVSDCFSWCLGITAFCTQPKFWTHPNYGVKEKGSSPNFVSNINWI